LGLRRETQPTEAAAQPLAHLRAQQADVAATIDLAQAFTRLVRQRQPACLDPWRQRATTSTVDAVRRCATGLYEDDEAVKAGGPLPGNAGPVAGPIHRLTMLKRQMFGRARLDLLSSRFGLAPRERRPPAAGPREQLQGHAVALSPRVAAEGRRGLRADGRGGTPAVRGGRTGQGRALQANVGMRGRLACEGSPCPLPCGVRELGIISLFRLSPKWGVNPCISEGHT
jgi:hypothetical protein